jgi:hypothetical protein
LGEGYHRLRISPSWETFSFRAAFGKWQRICKKINNIMDENKCQYHFFIWLYYTK